MKKALLPWLKEHIGIVSGVLSITTMALAAAGYWGYVAHYRLPDIDKRIEEIKKAEADRWTESERRQVERFARVDTGITALKVNLLSLMQKTGRPPTPAQLKELVSSVENTASATAQLVKEVRIVEGVGDKLPTITNWTGLNLAAGMKFAPGQLYSIDSWSADLKNPPGSTMVYTGYKDIAPLLTRLLVADTAHWEEADGYLRVKYDKGVMFLAPKKLSDLKGLKLWATEANALNDNLSAIAKSIPNITDGPRESVTPKLK